MSIMPLILLFTATSFYMAKCPNSSVEKISAMKEQILQVLNFIIFLLYPGICTRIFRLAKCRLIGDNYYLVADFSIKCWQNDHTLAVSVAALCCVVYVIGIPLGTVYVMYKNKTVLDQERTVKLYGSLYMAYERQFWYWEAVEMIKK